MLPLLLLVAGCGDDDDDDDDGATETTTTVTVGDGTTTTSTTSTTLETTTTTAFEGATTPTSTASTASSVGLLTDVLVEDGSVSFAFRDETPGYQVQYVQPPITQDGSGEEVTVGGSAFLSVRMEPASGVDLAGEEFEETYTGPDRVAGLAPVVEVVRTGDFEAVLNWVIGFDRERAFRVEVDGSTVRVLFDAA